MKLATKVYWFTGGENACLEERIGKIDSILKLSPPKAELIVKSLVGKGGVFYRG